MPPCSASSEPARGDRAAPTSARPACRAGRFGRVAVPDELSRDGAGRPRRSRVRGRGGRCDSARASESAGVRSPDDSRRAALATPVRGRPSFVRAPPRLSFALWRVTPRGAVDGWTSGGDKRHRARAWGAPGTGAVRGGAFYPRRVLAPAAPFDGEADSCFSMCMSLPQTRQRGGHRSVPVTQYPQQEYVTAAPAPAPHRGPSAGWSGAEGS